MDRIPVFRWSPQAQIELQSKGLTVSLDVASKAFGIGRSFGQRLAREGNFPCRVLTIGNRRRVATADLLAVLGLSGISDIPPAA